MRHNSSQAAQRAISKLNLKNMFTALEIAHCGCQPSAADFYSVLKDQKQLVYRVQFIFFSGENIPNDFLDCIAAKKSVELAVFTCGDVN